MTDAQKSKLPEELRTVLERFHHDPQLLAKLRNVLRIASQEIAQRSLKHETFCDTFQPPYKLPPRLLQYYGLSEREMKIIMEKIGFEKHRQYTSEYYQVFCISYLIGLEFNDENIRKMSILMIDIRLWNGRKMKFFPKFCDPDTARYVMNYVLKGNHTYKRYGSAFKYLDEHSIPAVDLKYHTSIANNLDSFTEGLRKLIETNHSRFRQLFNSIQKAYYKTYAEGKKEIISGLYKNQYDAGDMVEAKESFSSTVERLTDKIQKNAMLKRNVLMRPEAKQVFRDNFQLSDANIKKFNDWLEDDDNHEEIKYFFELVFTSFKPRDESDICKFDIEVLGLRITGAKKDQNLVKAKQVLDHMIMGILGNRYNSLTMSSLYRTKKIASYAIMTYAKILLCKKI